MTEPNTSKNVVWHEHFKTFGIYAVIAAAIAMGVLYWATSKEIEAANQKAADLLVRIGAAQNRIADLETAQQKLDADMKKVDEGAAKFQKAIDRLNKIDPDHLDQALDIMSKSGIQALREEAEGMQMTAQSVERLDRAFWKVINLTTQVQQDVRMVYQMAYLTEKERKDDTNAFRNGLATFWSANPTIRIASFQPTKEFQDKHEKVVANIINYLKERDSRSAHDLRNTEMEPKLQKTYEEFWDKLYEPSTQPTTKQSASTQPTTTNAVR